MPILEDYHKHVVHNSVVDRLLSNEACRLFCLKADVTQTWTSHAMVSICHIVIEIYLVNG